MRHRVLTMLVAAGTLVATVYLYGLVPKGFIPNQDTGQLQGSTEAPQDISFDAMVQRQQQVADDRARTIPNIEAFSSSVGGGGGGRASAAATRAASSSRLKPRAERQADAGSRSSSELRPKLNAIPGIRTYLQNPPLVRIGGQVSRSLYQYTLQAPELDELYRAAADFEKRMRDMPGLTDVNSDLQISSPQVIVDIDRDRASALGVTADADRKRALQCLRLAPGLEHLHAHRRLPGDPGTAAASTSATRTRCNMLYVRSATGKLVAAERGGQACAPTWRPLTRGAPGTVARGHDFLQPAPGVSLGEAVDRVQQAGRAKSLPDTVRTSFQGVAAAFQSSLGGMGVLLVMAILVIYMVLGILYESFIHPITILSGLPSAGLGALATLLIFHDELNIYSFVGIIMLIGIVKKNAIMMIDFALEAQRDARHGARRRRSTKPAWCASARS